MTYIEIGKRDSPIPTIRKKRLIKGKKGIDSKTSEKKK